MDQQYYTLQPAAGTKETGMAYPSVDYYDNYDFDGPRSIYKIRFDQFPDFVPDLRFKLARGAKLCDMMSVGGSNSAMKLISQRLHDFILSNAILPSHRFYDCFIETKDGIIKYYFLHLVNPELIEYIDFEKTIFFKKKNSENLEILNINSYQDYLRIKADLGILYTIRIKKFSLLKPIPYKVFIMPFILETLISKDLYLILNKEKFSGIELKELSL